VISTGKSVLPMLDFSKSRRWIKEEDILYIRAIRGVPGDMQEKLPGEYHKVLDTTVRHGLF
jgi:hypothetical protein